MQNCLFDGYVDGQGVAEVVHYGDAMAARIGAYTHLVYETGFSYVVLVNVPIDGGVAVVMSEVENYLAGRPVKLPGQCDFASVFRIDEFHFRVIRTS